MISIYNTKDTIHDIDISINDISVSCILSEYHAWYKFISIVIYSA